MRVVFRGVDVQVVGRDGGGFVGLVRRYILGSDGAGGGLGGAEAGAKAGECGRGRGRSRLSL